MRAKGMIFQAISFSGFKVVQSSQGSRSQTEPERLRGFLAVLRGLRAWVSPDPHQARKALPHAFFVGSNCTHIAPSNPYPSGHRSHLHVHTCVSPKGTRGTHTLAPFSSSL
ncbi:hypothetical protein AMTR_s00117p00091310 [Amborella trichopoda]|uniref:Uncharacterized protein n=1 Tax=Amborella trichopoda TaxID=13333 RepID=W1NQC7_AMBTC|nr:hypothetical protein AMTR_s00117p00091310 [Amborella trichopoda]